MQTKYLSAARAGHDVFIQTGGHRVTTRDLSTAALTEKMYS